MGEYLCIFCTQFFSSVHAITQILLACLSFDLREQSLLSTDQRALVPVHYLTVAHITAITYLSHQICYFLRPLKCILGPISQRDLKKVEQSLKFKSKSGLRSGT